MAQTVSVNYSNFTNNACYASNLGDGSTADINATFAAPSGATNVTGQAVGGGGGGGGADYNWVRSSGGRGGGGGYTTRNFGNSTGASATIRVGRGGTRGEMNGTVATAGTQSYITYAGTTISANGGARGEFCKGCNGSSGAGGSATGGTTNVSGYHGADGSYPGYSGGRAYGSPFNGAGGGGAPAGSKGINGCNAGGGGSGGVATIGTKEPGAYGGGGYVRISFNLATPVISGAATICSGSSITLTATAGADVYVWLRNGSEFYRGGNTCTFTHTATATYTVQARYRYSYTGSPAFSLPSGFTNILDDTPGFVNVRAFAVMSSAVTVTVANLTQTNPTAATICTGTTYTFSLAAATGAKGTVAYQWQSSPDNITWTNISGAISATYITPALTSKMYYRRQATDDCKTITSASALVTVTAPQVSDLPIPSSICGTSYTLPMVPKLEGGVGVPTNYTYSYTGGVQSVTLPAGTYTLECWGANGSNYSSGAGGTGGYSKGTYTIASSTTLYIGVGQGLTGTGGNKGAAWNGGGSGGPYGGSGGGATHIATATGALSSLSSNQSAVRIVAGGGGGSGYSATIGGHGGGSTGQIGGIGTTTTAAGGGTQSAGGAGGTNSSSSYTNGNAGSFGQGGGTSGDGGSGGGGWYGGGRGASGGSDGGGGGGSGYIGGVTGGVTAQPSQTGFVANPVTNGNGYARITGNSTITGQWEISTTVGGSTYTTLAGTTITSADNGKNIRYKYTTSCGDVYSNVVKIDFIDCSCANTGTTLFLEDFGGDAPGDPAQLPYTNHPQVGRYLSGTTTLTPAFVGGGYLITKQAVAMNPAWVDFTADASSPNGYMMAINAAGDGAQFYEMQIDGLCDLNNLFFSAKIGNLVNVDIIHPNLRFQLFDADNNTLLKTYDTGEIPYGTTPNVWRNFGFPFSVPAGVSSIICKITDKQICYDADGQIAGDCGGNDFVIDDIKVTFCVNKATTSPTGQTAPTCGFTNLAGSFSDANTPFGSVLESFWEFSTTGNINNPAAWTEIPGTRKTTFSTSISNNYCATLMGEGYYRFIVSNSSNITSLSCRSVSDPVKFISDNPTITIDCLEPTVETCDDEYFLQASYVDADGTLGNVFDYRWEYRAPGSTQADWEPIYGTEGSVTDGTLFTNYIASVMDKGSGYYRLAVIYSDGFDCTIPSNDTYIIFNPKPMLFINNPPAVPHGTTVDITSPSVILYMSAGATPTFWLDPKATSVVSDPQHIDATGVYYIKATDDVSGCYTIQPVAVTILPVPPPLGEMGAKVNQQTRGTFFSGPFIPTTIGPGNIEGRTCYNVNDNSIFGMHTYTFTNNTGATITSVSYLIAEDNDNCIDEQYTPKRKTLAASLPNGSPIPFYITFKDDLPSSTNATVVIYIIYYNGTDFVRVEKTITIQSTACPVDSDNPVIPPCPSPFEVNSSQSGDLYTCRVSTNVPGSTIEWLLNGERQAAAANLTTFTFNPSGKTPGYYVVKAVVISGCDCEMKIISFDILVLPPIVDKRTIVKVTYGTSSSTTGGTFTKNISVPYLVRAWGGGGGSGRAGAEGYALFHTKDGVAGAGGGGGGGYAQSNIPSNYMGTVTVSSVGVGGAGVVANPGGNGKQYASAGTQTYVYWGSSTLYAYGGSGGQSASGYRKTDWGYGGAGGNFGGTAADPNTSRRSASGGNGDAVCSNTRGEWVEGGSGGFSYNHGWSTNQPGYYKRISGLENNKVAGYAGRFPGGGATGAIAYQTYRIFGLITEERAAGGKGANGMVTFEFTYEKPVIPYINAMATNVYRGNTVLKIFDMVFDPSNFDYQWYQDGTPVSGATGQTYTVVAPGVYKVSAKSKNILPPTASFPGAASIVLSPNNDGSSGSGSNLTIGTAKEEHFSPEITFN